MIRQTETIIKQFHVDRNIESENAFAPIKNVDAKFSNTQHEKSNGQ